MLDALQNLMLRSITGTRVSVPLRAKERLLGLLPLELVVRVLDNHQRWQHWDGELEERVGRTLEF